MNNNVSASLPKIRESWVFFNEGYKFEIRRKAFRNHRRFHLEDHYFEASLKLLDDKKAPKLINVLEDIRSGLVQLIRNLQDLYKTSNRESQIYLFFDEEESHSFVGVATGNYRLFSANPSVSDHLQAEKIAINGLGLLRSVLQSHQKISLTKSFVIKVTVLHKRHLDYKRKIGTLKDPVYVD